jgi:predicted SprT family Zn-dependent metalloprotease
MDVLVDAVAALNIDENANVNSGNGHKVDNCVVPLKYPSTPFDIQMLEGRAFVKEREVQLEILLALYCAVVFDGIDPPTVTWNVRLNSTAGVTKLTSEGKKRTATIELASKVVDSTPKLINTLCHELCHAAMWIFDSVKSPPHGDAFKKWARRAEACFPRLDIKTCHNYDINYKFRWRCSGEGCLAEVGRHSNSLDTSAYVCALCGGKFVRYQ